MVQANVGQKLVKSNILWVFSKSDGFDHKPISPEVILDVNHSLKQSNAILTPPPTKYPIVLLRWFSSVWFVIPLLIVGAILLLRAHFQCVDNEKTPGVCMSDWWYQSKCLPDGGVQWLLAKFWTSSIRQCAWYRTGTLPWPLKWPAK